MKIVCDFCKTEYKLDGNLNGPVKCAVCGHVWTPYKSISQRTVIKFMAAVCALIAAVIFSVVVLVNFSGKSEKNKTIFANIDEKSVHIVKDKDGVNRVFVSGNITNNTDEMYGVPNVVIISYDANNNVLSRQTFMPPVTFLESKTTVTFNHILSVDASSVKRVSVELKESK